MNEQADNKTYGLFSTPTNKKLISTLREKNQNVSEFTYGNIEKLEVDDDNRKIFEHISKFDWIILTDIFAADFFLEELESNNIEIFEMDNIRVCAFGEAVADRLRFVQIHSDIIAQKIDENEIAGSIFKYIGNSTDLETQNFLVVKAVNADFTIANILAGRNLNVSEFLAYEFISPPQSEITKQKTLIKGGAIDAFVFCSVEDVMQFKFQFPAEFIENDLFELIYGTNEITLKVLEEFAIKGFYFQK